MPASLNWKDRRVIQVIDEFIIKQSRFEIKDLQRTLKELCGVEPSRWTCGRHVKERKVELSRLYGKDYLKKIQNPSLQHIVASCTSDVNLHRNLSGAEIGDDDCSNTETGGAHLDDTVILSPNDSFGVAAEKFIDERDISASNGVSGSSEPVLLHRTSTLSSGTHPNVTRCGSLSQSNREREEGNVRRSGSNSNTSGHGGSGSSERVLQRNSSVVSSESRRSESILSNVTRSGSISPSYPEGKGGESGVSGNSSNGSARNTSSRFVSQNIGSLSPSLSSGSVEDMTGGGMYVRRGNASVMGAISGKGFEVGEANLDLSKQLNRTILTIPIGNGFVRRFSHHRTSPNGRSSLFYCARCKYLGQVNKTGRNVYIVVRDGIVKSQSGIHENDCYPLKWSWALVENIDRCSRLHVRNGDLEPRQSWNKAHSLLRIKSIDENLALRGQNSLMAQLPAWENVQRQYLRHQSALKPVIKDPFCLPEVYRVTVRDGKRWLLNIPSASGVIGFASDDMLKFSASCFILIGDATFGIAPKDFAQFYSLHAPVMNETGKRWVLVASALMKNKSVGAYEAFFRALSWRWKALGSRLEFSKILTDFERSEMKAIRNVFGENMVLGCMFHYCKAIHTKLRSVGLQNYYCQKTFGVKNPVWRYCRRLMALALLPPVQVLNAWREVLSITPKCEMWYCRASGLEWPQKELADLRDYFEKQWIGRGRLEDIAFWNHWYSKIDRTTNAAEAFHSVLAKRIDVKKHPSCTNFIPMLQEIHDLQMTRLDQVESGEDLPLHNWKYIQLEVRLANYKLKFHNVLNSRITADKLLEESFKYLDRCSYLLAKWNKMGVTAKMSRIRKENRPENQGTRGDEGKAMADGGDDGAHFWESDSELSDEFIDVEGDVEEEVVEVDVTGECDSEEEYINLGFSGERDSEEEDVYVDVTGGISDSEEQDVGVHVSGEVSGSKKGRTIDLEVDVTGEEQSEDKDEMEIEEVAEGSGSMGSNANDNIQLLDLFEIFDTDFDERQLIAEADEESGSGQGRAFDYCTQISKNVVKRANVTCFSDTLVSRDEWKWRFEREETIAKVDDLFHSPAMMNSTMSKKLVKNFEESCKEKRKKVADKFPWEDGYEEKFGSCFDENVGVELKNLQKAGTFCNSRNRTSTMPSISSADTIGKQAQKVAVHKNIGIGCNNVDIGKQPRKVLIPERRKGGCQNVYIQVRSADTPNHRTTENVAGKNFVERKGHRVQPLQKGYGSKQVAGNNVVCSQLGDARNVDSCAGVRGKKGHDSDLCKQQEKIADKSGHIGIDSLKLSASRIRNTGNAGRCALLLGKKEVKSGNDDEESAIEKMEDEIIQRERSWQDAGQHFKHVNPLADGDESVTDLTDRISKQLQDNVISKSSTDNLTPETVNFLLRLSDKQFMAIHEGKLRSWRHENFQTREKIPDYYRNVWKTMPVMFFPPGVNDFIYEILLHIYAKSGIMTKDYVFCVLLSEALVNLYKVAKSKKTRQEADSEMDKFRMDSSYWAEDQKYDFTLRMKI